MVHRFDPTEVHRFDPTEVHRFDPTEVHRFDPTRYLRYGWDRTPGATVARANSGFAADPPNLPTCGSAVLKDRVAVRQTSTFVNDRRGGGMAGNRLTVHTTQS
jgi:hypothetical protein